MKTTTIFNLLQMYINREPMPKRVKWWLAQDGYEYFRWDEDAEEYINEGDPTWLMREIPWHHYTEEGVDIIEE